MNEDNTTNLAYTPPPRVIHTARPRPQPLAAPHQGMQAVPPMPELRLPLSLHDDPTNLIWRCPPKALPEPVVLSWQARDYYTTSYNAAELRQNSRINPRSNREKPEIITGRFRLRD